MRAQSKHKGVCGASGAAGRCVSSAPPAAYRAEVQQVAQLLVAPQRSHPLLLVHPSRVPGSREHGGETAPDAHPSATLSPNQSQAGTVRFSGSNPSSPQRILGVKPLGRYHGPPALGGLNSKLTPKAPPPPPQKNCIFPD